MRLEAVLLFFHIVAAVIWVGGMFFAHQCLRPAAMAVLEPPQRLGLWDAVFARFFPWVGAAVAILVLSGTALLHRVGMGTAPRGWIAMSVIGLLMAAIYVYIVAVPYRRLRNRVAAQAWPEAAQALASIRQAVGVNLVLGLATIALATVAV